MSTTGSGLVVTDLGFVGASGVGVERAWNTLVRGRSCIGPVRSFDASAYPVALGAELLDVPEVGRDDDERSIRFLLAAAETFRTDLSDYLHDEPRSARRTAVVLGTSKGSVLGMAPIHRKLFGSTVSLSSEELDVIDAYRPGYGTTRLAAHLGALGSQSTVSLACASSSMAIIHGVELIRHGIADRVIAGGFDGFSPFIFAGFNSIGALTTTRCRPFDRRRDGTVLGEGAALLVIESKEAAGERGATPLAIYEGSGHASDGVHLTAPDREGRGLTRAIEQALHDAGVTPEDLDYINAHGTGTKFNDAMECQAFANIFETIPKPPPISSIKSVFGHTLGAAGAMDAVISISAMHHNTLPPTVDGGVEPEVEGWDFVPSRARPVPDLTRVLSTSAGFAGNNTALLFGSSSSEDSRTGASEELPRPYRFSTERQGLGGGR